MILGFSTKHKALKQETRFREQILDGTKKHTLRAGDRWAKDMKIHMATGVRTKNYNQFNKNRPDLQTCKGTQRIKLEMSKSCWNSKVYVDNRKLTFDEMIQLSINDGFSCFADFWLWFLKVPKHKLPNQIVHWTDLRY